MAATSPQAALERAALRYASIGWRVLPVKPRGKSPLTGHGVKDAGRDERQIRKWWSVHPDANIGIATGAPGPTVLDIDAPELVPAHLEFAADTPAVTTARGRHLYFAGLARPTITFAFGELRGRGGYVVTAPSIHAKGNMYVWTPGSRPPLPPVPYELLGKVGTSTGSGVQPTRSGPVPRGQRHLYLIGVAVRLVRGGFTDMDFLLAHLRVEFERACEARPALEPGEIEAIGKWASESNIADRERANSELAMRLPRPPDRWWSTSP